MRVVTRVLLVVCVAGVLGGGCAHSPLPDAPPVDARRAQALEREFTSFTQRNLESEVALEVAQAQLEELRMRYVDVLAASETDVDRLYALVRIAELHLDLGARVRRVPYPPALDAAAKARFDESLSRRALPLEAIGVGVLRQVVEYAERRELDGRFVRRARLYLALHHGPGMLSRDDVTTLRRELGGGAQAAPRRLLEAGRIGQRAARR